MTSLSVWVDTPTGQESGRVVGPAGLPRSFDVEVQSGEVHSNRVHLRIRAEPGNAEPTDTAPAETA